MTDGPATGQGYGRLDFVGLHQRGTMGGDSLVPDTAIRTRIRTHVTTPGFIIIEALCETVELSSVMSWKDWKASDDPVLERFRERFRGRFRTGVDQMYGDQVARVVLFGSRARGDPQPASEYDIAVFLRDRPDRFAVLRRLADLGTDILYGTGEIVNALPYRADTYNDPRMPLMHEIRRDGVDL